MINYTFEYYSTSASAWVALPNIARPFTDGDALDESLDSGVLNTAITTVREPFAPFTRLKITVSDGTTTETIYRVVESDYVVCKRLGASAG